MATHNPKCYKQAQLFTMKLNKVIKNVTGRRGGRIYSDLFYSPTNECL